MTLLRMFRVPHAHHASVALPQVCNLDITPFLPSGLFYHNSH